MDRESAFVAAIMRGLDTDQALAAAAGNPSDPYASAPRSLPQMEALTAEARQIDSRITGQLSQLEGLRERIEQEETAAIERLGLPNKQAAELIAAKIADRWREVVQNQSADNAERAKATAELMDAAARAERALHLFPVPASMGQAVVMSNPALAAQHFEILRHYDPAQLAVAMLHARANPKADGGVFAGVLHAVLARLPEDRRKALDPADLRKSLDLSPQRFAESIWGADHKAMVHAVDSIRATATRAVDRWKEIATGKPNPLASISRGLLARKGIRPVDYEPDA